jgi:putative transcription antitermination factor YqgF
MGLAVGDDATGIVTPLEVVSYHSVDSAAQLIAMKAGETGASGVVLGLPTLADGTRGAACRRSEELADALATLGISVEFQSEYLTTDEARRRARSAGRSPRQPVDDIAAQVLLEEFLTTRRPGAEI